MSRIPDKHVTDSLQLVEADAYIYLYQISPAIGSGTVFFKEGATATWQDDEYVGIGLSFTGEEFGSDGSPPTPRLVLGKGEEDFSRIKPLIFDGALDGGRVRRIRLLLDDLVHDRAVYRDFWYRIKKPDEYTARKISLVLATYADSTGAELPYRRFTRPEFPFVSE